MNNQLNQIRHVCITALFILLISFHYAGAEPVISSEKDYTVLPENGTIIAAFFPGKSTFSHSRLKNSIIRKKKKTKKIQKRNRIIFNKFIDNEKSLISSFEKIEKKNLHFFYWQLGNAIFQEEQKQIKLKGYYPFFIQSLAITLNIPDYTIEKTKKLFMEYPVIALIPQTLSWDHLDLLLDISDNSVRDFYNTHVLENQVSPDELRVLINSNVHETVENEK